MVWNKSDVLSQLSSHLPYPIVFSAPAMPYRLIRPSVLSQKSFDIYPLLYGLQWGYYTLTSSYSSSRELHIEEKIPVACLAIRYSLK
jgi:hypothetical protein